MWAKETEYSVSEVRSDMAIIFKGIFEALEYMVNGHPHHPVVHRDLKQQNVLVPPPLPHLQPATRPRPRRRAHRPERGATGAARRACGPGVPQGLHKAGG